MNIEISEELFPVFATFRDETKEIRAEMTADLLTLEGRPDAPPAGVFERIVRNAHTLKGNSSSLGLEDVAALMHSVESLLTEVVGPDRRLEPGMLDVLLSAIDEVLRRAEDILVNRADSGGIQAAHALVERMLARAEERPRRPATLSNPARPAAGEELLKIGVSQFEGFSQVVDELGPAVDWIAERAAEATAGAHALHDFVRRSQGLLAAELGDELARIAAAAEALERSLHADAGMIGAVTDELRGGLRMLQLVKASSMLAPLRRAVHEHARQVGKEAQLDIAGTEALVDRRILQELRGAIAHLLRNAVDHGIELPSERAAAGKPTRASIHLELAASGAAVDVAVTDDGRGLDPERIRAAAARRGIVAAEEGRAMSDADVLRLIWRPGLSTAGAVTETSGRGLGLDAVSDCVSRLSGRVEVSSVVGRGTTFRLHVPLSQRHRASRADPSAPDQ